MIRTISFDDINESLIAERRVAFTNLTKQEVLDFLLVTTQTSFVFYQEYEDMEREEEINYVLAVDMRVLPSERCRPMELVNSPEEVLHPWQKCTDDLEQFYITLDVDDASILGLIEPKLSFTKPKSRIKLGGIK